MTVWDVIVVGAGPAGMNAALILARACRRVLVLDSNHPRNAMAQAVHGFLTRDGIPPGELRQAGQAELARYGVEVQCDPVIGAEAIADEMAQRPTLFEVRTASGTNHRGRKLLFATGTRDTLPDIPGFRECYGTTIHHCPYCDGWEYRDQTLVAYGQEPEAACGLALGLRNWSPQVTVLTDGSALPEDSSQRLERHGIAWRNSRLVRLEHRHNRLTNVQLADGTLVPAVALFFVSEQSAGCNLPQTLGVAQRSGKFAQSDDRQRTQVPGVFLAGDADGDVQFAIVAAAEGASAAVAINRELIEEDFP